MDFFRYLLLGILYLSPFFLVERLMRPSMIGRWRPHYWSRLFFLIALQSFITAPFFMGPLIGFFQWPLPYIFVLKKFWSEHSPIVYWLCAFLIFTFVHYWSHVARHRIPFLWRWCHQMHHGAERFEAYTSLYMHPFEVILLRLSLLPLLSFAGLDFKTLSVLGLWYSFFNAWVHMNLGHRAGWDILFFVLSNTRITMPEKSAILACFPFGI